MEQTVAKDTTPEKKLLKIIETGNQKAQGQEQAVVSKSVKEYKRGGLFNAGAAKGNLFFFLEKFKNIFPKKAFSLDLKKINLFLILVTFLLIVFISVTAVRYGKDANKVVKLSSEDVREQTSMNNILPKKESVATSFSLPAFLEKLKQRDLFKPVIQKPKLSNLELASAKAAEAAKNLRLVGISVSKNPDESYAMVEDTTTKTTHFIKKGDIISGVKVSDILADKIILNFEDQFTELR